MSDSAKIFYTITDEAPALATQSFLPIVRTFLGPASITVETADISLAARILSVFNDLLPEKQRVDDSLQQLGDLAKTPAANIIKLPNISASVPQLKAAIEELQAKGFEVPDYPDDPATDKEKDARSRFDKVKGSAVNPVLREGNSDRRAPQAVKNYAKQNPHSMGAWSADSKTSVATMGDGDFQANEKSTTIKSADTLTVVHVGNDGKETTLKDAIPVLDGEIIDATYMSRKALISFLDAQVKKAKQQDVLFSLHMKATMMKVSDPIIFGAGVEVYFADLFKKHGSTLAKAGADVRNGFGNLLSSLESLPAGERAEIEKDIAAIYAAQPDLAMVNSDKGITNLHVPSDIIIDASMPAMIRSSGQMWNTEGKLQDTLAVIPDSSYADLYTRSIQFHKDNGAFDPTSMGTCPNVGLMAQKAEEYGSHDKTFEIASDGKVQLRNSKGDVLTEHNVEAGDIWRSCQVKDAPIKDWVQLAVSRAKATGWPAVFWLDKNRAHDAELITKVEAYLKDHDTDSLDIKIMSVAEATDYTLDRIKRGEDTISVTGNVLRDYLTDLFPILELGTSAKMLSIVPLMSGGGLFETGAGGSAPKHVQQFEEENHLRWDSLGEFLALAVSLEHLSEKNNNKTAAILGDTLNDATEKLLINRKSPSRKVGELDTRGSHFYLTMYWAEALANQTEDSALAKKFAPLAKAFSSDEKAIVDELNKVQGQAMDIGGYYFPDTEKSSTAMRPSATLNKHLTDFSKA